MSRILGLGPLYRFDEAANNRLLRVRQFQWVVIVGVTTIVVGLGLTLHATEWRVLALYGVFAAAIVLGGIERYAIGDAERVPDHVCPMPITHRRRPRWVLTVCFALVLIVAIMLTIGAIASISRGEVGPWIVPGLIVAWVASYGLWRPVRYRWPERPPWQADPDSR